MHKTIYKNSIKPENDKRNLNHLSNCPIITQIIIMSLLIIAVVLFTHWPSLSSQAVSIDDNMYIIDNNLVQNPGWISAGRFLGEVFKPTTVSGYYQPVTMISLMMDYAFGAKADNLHVFHVTNLIIHLLNTILAAVFIYMLFKKLWIAGVTALLFGVHPITLETVVWVSERKTLLAAFFVILAVILYLLNVNKKRKIYFILSILSYSLALLSKPTSLPLPFILLLLDFWPLKRLNKQSILNKIPYFVLFMVFSIITLVSQSRSASILLPNEISNSNNFSVFFHNVYFYFQKIFWPFNLSPYYDFSFTHNMIIFRIIFTFSLLTLLIMSLRWSKAVFTGLSIYFMMLFPTMGLIGFTHMISSNKYVYLPSLGLLVVIACLLLYLKNRIASLSKRSIASVCLISVLLLTISTEAIASRQYVKHWRDTETLYNYMLKLYPDSGFLHNNLGFTYKNSGNLQKAEYHCQKAVRLNPGSITNQLNLGITFVQQGKLNQAVSSFEKCINLNPEYYKAYYNLGVVMVKLEKIDEAVYNFKKSVDLNPAYALPYYNLGVVYAWQGRLNQSLDMFRKVIEINPFDKQAKESLKKVEDFINTNN